MKVALLMSGGVDSSYCAYLLKSSGYEVLGIYLKLHDREDKHEFYIKNCIEVSKRLDFEFRVIDAKDKFKQSVYDEFVDAYKRGETPNPCALCNPLMKFGFALDEAKGLGCEKIATGHYARIINLNDTNRVAQAIDDTKDQSYFLYAISQEAIDRLIFPLGDYKKEDVKKKAFEAMPWFGTLETYKESQEICFVDTNYVDILKKHHNVEVEGKVRDLEGNIVGLHKGYMQYTIGKRHGFSVRGSHEPHYVLKIDPQANEIVVGKKEDLKSTEVRAKNKSLRDFVDGEYEVKIRYRSAKTKARVSIEGDEIIACLSEPVYGVANGQALVVYDGDCVLGGGVIR